MKELDWIIQEQANLLREKGYNESSINSQESEGSYKLHLKDLIRDILDAEGTTIGSVPVTLRLFGHYDDTTVLFTLTYDFDLAPRALNLQMVEAAIGAIKLKEQIDHGNNLWPAKELYQRAKGLHDVIKSHDDLAWETKLQTLLEQQAALLHGKGYGDRDQLKTKMNSSIAGIIDAASPERSFILKCKVKTKPFINPIYARFHYQMIPAGPNLQLKSIQFSMSKMKELILKPNDKDIPIPHVIGSRLAEADTIKRTNEILKALGRPLIGQDQLKKGKS